ncbi:hypothetical protein HYZ97_03765 [Candidatus Pacearchaeota archaeon]|nr:hypothetical protein [Candidatus Pacearchaeota archaeon]
MKRGEIATSQIIGLVLVLIGFAAILVFFYNTIDLGLFAEDAACKASVLTRAVAPSAAQGILPLKCTTKKICITSGKGKCEEQFRGEKNVEVIKLRGSATNPTDRALMRQTIEQVTAESMYSCWSTMGEGKVDIFGSFSNELGLTSVVPSCVICSRIAIDKGVDRTILYDEAAGIGVNVNEYMRKTVVPGTSVTFLQAFTDKSVSSYAYVNNDQFGLLKEKQTIQKVLADDIEQTESVNVKKYIDTVSQTTFAGRDASTDANREMALVFMQVKSIKPTEVLRNMFAAGGTVAGVTFMTPVVNRVAAAGARAILFNPYGQALTLIGASTVGGYGAYNAYQGQLAAAGYCGQFSTNDAKAREGCSLVQGVNYNFKDINTLCSSIQGNP